MITREQLPSKPINSVEADNFTWQAKLVHFPQVFEDRSYSLSDAAKLTGVDPQIILNILSRHPGLFNPSKGVLEKSIELDKNNGQEQGQELEQKKKKSREQLIFTAQDLTLLAQLKKLQRRGEKVPDSVNLLLRIKKITTAAEKYQIHQMLMLKQQDPKKNFEEMIKILASVEDSLTEIERAVLICIAGQDKTELVTADELGIENKIEVYQAYRSALEKVGKMALFLTGLRLPKDDSTNEVAQE